MTPEADIEKNYMECTIMHVVTDRSLDRKAQWIIDTEK